MKQAPRILFYVQYLLGIGHLQRSSLVVKALCEQGAQVDVIFGGVAVSNISFGRATIHQLPAVKAADASFSGLVQGDGSEFTEQDKQRRVKQLLEICDRVQPDLIVTETYPFGRRQMRFELVPLLDWVAERKASKTLKAPVLVTSIRDILQKRSDKREQECLDLIQRHYQYVLVHGDLSLFPLSESFSKAQQIADKIHYSGYVCPTLDLCQNNLNTRFEPNTVVVSIGGGSVGKEILQAALTLQQSGFLADHHWLLITGPNMASQDKLYFQAQQSDRLKVVELADNFLLQLSNANLSISMAGYNTVMDILLTKVRAVVVPFEGDGETEQLTRSELLAKQQILVALKETELTAASLQQAITQALNNKPQIMDIKSNGAQHSAQLLCQWALENREKAE